MSIIEIDYKKPPFFQEIEPLAKDICLGIHYSSSGLTAALVRQDRQHPQKAAVFKVAASQETGDGEVSSLLEQLARQLDANNCRRAPVALALAGAMYHSQFHHSEFSDPRQIRQTLRFDVEEDFSADAENLTLCFQQVPSPGAGTDLVVYTLNKEKILSVLSCFEKAGLDALVAQPDITAWVHYLKAHPNLPQGQPLLAVAWSAGTLYTLVLDKNLQPLLTRTCLCTTSAYAHEILAGELRRTLLLLPNALVPQHLLYHGGGFTQEQITQLQRQTNLKFISLDEGDAAAAFAAGAAISFLRGSSTADFRADGMAPRTVVAAQRKALYGLSVAAGVLFCSLMVVFNAYAGHYQRVSDDSIERMEKAYRDTHAGQKSPSGTNISRQLKTQLRQMNSESRIQTDRIQPGSASHALMLLLQALNTLPYDFDLQIKSLLVANDSVTMRGSVSDLERQIELDARIRAHPQLKVENWDSTLVQQGDTTRRNFNTSLSIVRTDLGPTDEE